MSADELHSPLRVHPVRYLLTTVALMVALAAGVFIGGYKKRQDDFQMAVNTSVRSGVVTVSAAKLGGNNSGENVSLPGVFQAQNAAPIYSMVSGYLKTWYFDIGRNVKAGQVLAEIHTPELEQQLKQAMATLETSKANENLALITANRWRALLQTDAVSHQEADEKFGDYQAKKTIVAAAQANVDRLRTLESYKRIVAPFDGVITGRNTDIGALINAGQQSGRELFTLSDTRKLRLYVTVPQTYLSRIKPDMKVVVEVPEMPGKKIPARLVNTSKSINEASGTMLLQFEIDNPQQNLVPGEYGNVSFAFPLSDLSIHLPPSALIIRKDGPHIAVAGQGGKVSFRKIEILRDLVTTVEASFELSSTETVIDNPPESLQEGDVVTVKSIPASLDSAKK
jgi:RND family efflux transporter MFP subunit